MNKSFYLKIIFWVLSLSCIVAFYFITDNKVETLIEENRKLSDSLNALQKNIGELELLLNKSDTAFSGKFDTILVKKTDSIYTYRFIPYYGKADSYLWDFGDGQKSSAKEPEHNFNLNKKSVFEVLLDVIKNKKSKQSKLKLVLPVVSKVSIKLDSTSFCMQNQGVYKFTLKPTGGIVTGAGVIKEKNNDFYFQPSNKNLKIGKNIISYKYNDLVKSLTVNIKDCSDSVKISIKLKYKEFCLQDSSSYIFETKYPGTVIEGNGVFLKGSSYYFVPSKVKPGAYTFTGRYKNSTTKINVRVKDCVRFNSN